MTWAQFYLVCFVVGFLFSLLSFVLGSFHWHMPFHFHVHGGGPLVHGGAAHGTSHHHAGVSPFNPATAAAFLTWFGGAGYLLTRHSSIVVMLALALAMGSGVIGAGIVFLFLSKVMISDKETLDPADFEMTGVLGRLSVPIREGGTGEMIYSQAGTRRTCGARSDNGKALAKGDEVVVTRYEKGIAYVRLWSELAGEDTDQVHSSDPRGGAQ